MFIERVGRIDFYHYDPYAQALSKVVRGFRKDLLDARQFVESGMVQPEMFHQLVRQVPASVYAKYPALTAASVHAAVDAFLSG